ncbi:family 6 glucosyltransferase [Chitinophaga lutea]
MKIAIVYVCTGKYSIFWKDFYTSSEQYFVPGAEKGYFVFTDDTALPFQDRPNVFVYPQERMGWPFDTLKRWHMFLRAEDALRNYDYIFFFNANAVFIKPIQAADILPGAGEDGLVVVTHPGYYNVPVHKKPFEKYYLRSKAYVPRNERGDYFQGCLSGGTSAEYLKMIHTLQENTDADLEKGIIAEWWDESHLNKYMVGRRPKKLAPAFAFQQGSDKPFEPVILMRDKGLFGGAPQLRSAPAKPHRTLGMRVWRKLTDVLHL